MNMEKIIAALIRLLEEQEGAKIDYTIKRKEQKERTA